MKKRTTTIIKLILLSSLMLVIIVGGIWFVYAYLSAFAPSKVKITRNEISSNGGFVNGVSIEKIQVDSMGTEYPLKYTVVYTTSCNMIHASSEQLHKIRFDQPGDYWWDEDTTKIQYIHEGLSRDPVEPKNEKGWLEKFGRHPVCPMKFEKEQWYFFLVDDRRITGIFFYIDKEDKEHQYNLYSGISPI